MSSLWSFNDDWSVEVKTHTTDDRVDGVLCTDGLLLIRFNGEVLSSRDVEANVRVRRVLVGDETDVYCLIDIRGTRAIESETRRQPINPRNKKVAVVYDSPVGRMIALAFQAQTQPECEFEVFTGLPGALEWLRT